MCAVKVLESTDAYDALQFDTEIRVLQLYRHTHVLGFLGSVIGPPRCLVSELMVNGSLEDRLARKGGTKVRGSALTHSHTRTLIYSYIHTFIHSSTCIHTHTHAYTLTHTHTHTLTHPHTHTLTHSHTHTLCTVPGTHMTLTHSHSHTVHCTRYSHGSSAHTHHLLSSQPHLSLTPLSSPPPGTHMGAAHTLTHSHTVHCTRYSHGSSA
jgi:hypothetical protein